MEYRIVKYYQSFFCRYAYRLELKVDRRFLWWHWIEWRKVAGNALTGYIPSDWHNLNIVDQIEELPK